MVGCRSFLERFVKEQKNENFLLYSGHSFFSEPYTTKSDVWSYGVTAWEVFSKAENPYSHIPNNHSVIGAVQRGSSFSILDHADQSMFVFSLFIGERLKQPDKCPPKMYNILLSCWAVNAKDRPTFEKLVENIKKEKSLF